ncbi:MAG: endonuclease/exonuclease/phosphatase family protein [Anaerolineae bacterium]
MKGVQAGARASAYVYGGLIALCLLLRLFLGEMRFLPLMIFDILLPGILFPGLLLLMLFALRRRWRLVLTQLPVLVGFVWLYGHILLPERLPAIPEGTQITVLTYNISLRDRGMDQEAALIREANADVVALQEVSERAGEYFDAELADLYPYRAIHGSDSPPGQAVLSRYPIVEDMTWEVERMHQRVVLDVNEQQVTFYNVHPVHFNLDRDHVVNFEAQLREVEDILARTAEETNPMLIVGDFNTTDQSAIYESFASVYSDSFLEVGSGFGLTFPSNLPLARLDYIFHTEAFTALDAEVWESSGGSDHYPVFARLELAGE